MQCLAKSLACVAVQSALDPSFISAHHFSLPISGAQLLKNKVTIKTPVSYKLLTLPTNRDDQITVVHQPL